MQSSLSNPSPIVSVLLITYNQKDYIAQAIESVLMQKTDFPFEVLIGDDCSTDGTSAIVGSYADAHPDQIRLVGSEHNVGGIANERRLMEQAQGKYLAFLEGDDFWTDEYKLQKQVDFLERNPDYGLVHSDVDHYYQHSGKTERAVNRSQGVHVPEGDLFKELLKPQPYFIKTATVCFRKELVSRYFDYDKAISDQWPLTDLPLWLDITAHARAHYMGEVLATYRLLNESASRTASPEKKLRYHLGLHRIKVWYLNKYQCGSEVRNEIEEYHYRGLLAIAFNLGDGNLAKESVRYLRQAHKKQSLKEKLLYVGANYPVLKYMINVFR